MIKELVLGDSQSFSARNFQEALLFEKETIKIGWTFLATAKASVIGISSELCSLERR